MTDQQQVVGYDPETGRAVVGYDPNTGKAVYASGTTTPEPFNAPRMVIPERQQRAIQARQGRMTPEQRQASMEALKTVAPVGAALLTAPFTAGLSLPASMGVAALAGGAGQAGVEALSDQGDDADPIEIAARILRAGLEQGVLQGAVGLATKAAPAVQQLARNLWKRGAKITMPTARTTQTMRQGGTLDEAKDEIAETVLSQGTGTIRRGNAQAMREQIRSLDDALDTVVANSSGMIRRQELRDALLAKAKEIGPPSTQAAQTELEALSTTFRLLKNEPPLMTVARAQALKRKVYETYEKTFAADAAEGARAMADKTVARAARQAIAREVPEAQALNEAMSRQIPATRAMDEAVSRVANHNLVGLTGTIAAASRQPMALAAALINHPQLSSFTAQQIYRVASLLPSNQRTATNVLRGLQMLTGTSTVPSRAMGAGPGPAAGVGGGS